MCNHAQADVTHDVQYMWFWAQPNVQHNVILQFLGLPNGFARVDASANPAIIMIDHLQIAMINMRMHVCWLQRTRVVFWPHDAAGRGRWRGKVFIIVASPKRPSEMNVNTQIKPHFDF